MKDKKKVTQKVDQHFNKRKHLSIRVLEQSSYKSENPIPIPLISLPLQMTYIPRSKELKIKKKENPFVFICCGFPSIPKKRQKTEIIGKSKERKENV